MTVLERDTQGLDGWWLCSLHGRQGIVPGNRLKILVGMYDKKPAGPGPGPPATPSQPQPQPQPGLPQGLHTAVPPTSQYAPMLPATSQPQSDSVYLVPTPSKTQQGLYQSPAPSPQFQSPPAKQTSTFAKQAPHHPFPSSAADLYQVPPGPGSPAQDIYQVPPSAGMGHDIYQVPPSMDARSWEGTKPQAKVRPPWWMGAGLCCLWGLYTPCLCWISGGRGLHRDCAPLLSGDSHEQAVAPRREVVSRQTPRLRVWPACGMETFRAALPWQVRPELQARNRLFWGLGPS